MSDNGNPIGVSGNALVWALAAMFIATIGGCVFLALGLEVSQNPAGLIALLLGAFSTLVASLGTLFAVSRVARRVERTGDLVDGLANGVGDAKFKRAVHAALAERDQSSDTEG